MKWSSTRVLAAAAITATVWVVGCSHEQKSLSTGAFIESHAQLENRRQNAEQISNGSVRNDALRSVALDAASQGVGDVAINATAEIDRPSLRDETAEQCARLLEDMGERAAAEKLADSISDTEARDRVRSYLASHTPPSK